MAMTLLQDKPQLRTVRAQHRRPLFAFVVVALVCGVVVAQALRSDAIVSVLHIGASNVVSGTSLLHAPPGEPSLLEARTVAVAAMSDDGPAEVTRGVALGHAKRKARGEATGHARSGTRSGAKVLFFGKARGHRTTGHGKAHSAERVTGHARSHQGGHAIGHTQGKVQGMVRGKAKGHHKAHGGKQKGHARAHARGANRR